MIADGSPSELDEAALERVYSISPRGAAIPGSSERARSGADAPVRHKPPEEWKLRQPITTRAIGIALVASLLLGLSAARTEIPQIILLTAQWVAAGLGLREHSQIGKGLERFASNALPLVIANETLVTRVEGLDRNHLPLFARIEKRNATTSRYDFEHQKMVDTVEPEEVLVEPYGYLIYVGGKMLQSLEISLWGTLFGLAIGLPLAYFGARGYSPNVALYGLARTASSFCRAVPELVSALILTLSFGFGPMAGVVALGFHSAGFFGKFLAEDVENADFMPQEALFAVGANRLKVLRYAVLPQVLPQYVAYTQYILERNVRMATVIGVVGAGGIGIELKGRYDMFDFGHLSTILVVIFVTVLLLEQVSHRLRRRLIAIS